MHDPRRLPGQRRVEARYPQPDDVALSIRAGVVQVQVQAPALERVGQLPGGVRGEEHQRLAMRGQGSELRDGDLEVGEDLEQERLGLDLYPVDLVDQQHDGVGRPDGREQGPLEQEVLGEDVRFRLVPGFLVARLDAQQLLLVVPFVEGLGLVDALVALQPQQPRSGDRGGRLGQLRLAHPGRPLDEERLAEPVRQQQGIGDVVIGQVAGTAEPVLDRHRAG